VLCPQKPSQTAPVNAVAQISLRHSCHHPRKEDDYKIWRFNFAEPLFTDVVISAHSVIQMCRNMVWSGCVCSLYSCGGELLGSWTMTCISFLPTSLQYCAHCSCCRLDFHSVFPLHQETRTRAAISISRQVYCIVHLFVAASALHCAKGKERPLLNQVERHVVNKMPCVVVVFIFSCSCDLRRMTEEWKFESR
jgi:hypothetical protein